MQPCYTGAMMNTTATNLRTGDVVTLGRRAQRETVIAVEHVDGMVRYLTNAGGGFRAAFPTSHITVERAS